MANPQPVAGGAAAAAPPRPDPTGFSAPTGVGTQLKGIVAQILDMVGDSRQFATLGIQHADRLEGAKLRSLARDRDSLKARLGDADPRVRALTNRIDVHRVLAVKLASLDARVANAPPKVPKKTGTIYGRVVTDGGVPVGGARVMARGAAGRTVASDVTDAKGRYELRMKAKRTTAAAAARAKQGVQAEELRLEVTAPGDATRYHESEPLALEVGQATYREVVLSPARGAGAEAKPKAGAKTGARRRTRPSRP